VLAVAEEGSVWVHFYRGGKEKVVKEREEKLHAVLPLMENIYTLFYLIFFFIFKL